MTDAVSAPNTAKNAQPIMLATRSDHGLRQQGGDKEDRADQGEHVGQRDIVEKNLQQAIEQRVVGDVVGVEAQLDQDFRYPEIIRGRVENSIKYCHWSAPLHFI